ncbi:hypothetical protein OE88DRAFT_1671543 [Heliocybe sulcata]|uniref:Mitochondrial import inner membrane translocase subunit Tim21 n=1 Tax=Heliocybe sulcata TaxID=5364 RepID=A0A5C3NJD7_9AGAM|nr:hypothetical protein OE88DRAFT_1671543 [Heliocybe sulcata]
MHSHLYRLPSRLQALARFHSNGFKFIALPRCRRALVRSYATHKDPVIPSSLLSQALDQRQRQARRDENIGPFQLGIVPPTPEEVGHVKKWSELSAGGKVARATARTTSLSVILFGAGLSAVLIYALTSELFSRNSPTVLYGEACEVVRRSSRVARYLPGPLAFHNSPPSSARPRHRNHQVASQLVLDAAGQEHLLLNFYVQSRASDPSSSSEDESYFAVIGEWFKHVSELTWDEAREAIEGGKRLVRYLAGKPEPLRPPPASAAETGKEEEKREDAGWWSFAGVFGGLRGALGAGQGGKEGGSRGVEGRVYTDGEVHADLVKDKDGYFRFRYILVDIPNSRTRNPIRVFVERSGDVRENEPVWRFTS